MTNKTPTSANTNKVQENYGNVDNAGFVTLLYQDILDREPDTDGLNYWVGELNGGATRESVLMSFSYAVEVESHRPDKLRDLENRVAALEVELRVLRNKIFG
ncbi:MAG: hypothetical protein CME02_06715 [Geminicoccus sp.]|nr:hypothetical protein [Geminicoccus sp.]